MKREFLITGDGSTTIHLPEWDEQYHSKHGAIAEARHVFLQTGLFPVVEKGSEEKISILEIGFGTGLNAFLTVLAAEKLGVHIDYFGIEAYPVLTSEVEKLNYPELAKASPDTFQKLHTCPWEVPSTITSYFRLTKRKQFFSEIEDNEQYQLIYFDAFGARVQPELWTEAIFERMFNALQKEGVLVTYAAKGSARRAMQAVGFTVERLPGPPGKREMLRATK